MADILHTFNIEYSLVIICINTTVGDMCGPCSCGCLRVERWRKTPRTRDIVRFRDSFISEAMISCISAQSIHIHDFSHVKVTWILHDCFDISCSKCSDAFRVFVGNNREGLCQRLNTGMSTEGRYRASMNMFIPSELRPFVTNTRMFKDGDHINREEEDNEFELDIFTYEEDIGYIIGSIQPVPMMNQMLDIATV